MFNLQEIRIVDVTLRDGGYRNNFNFSMDYILDHLRLMQESGVDFIEVGYRNGSAVNIKEIGRTGLSKNDYLEELRSACPEANLCVIAHEHNITEQDIQEMAYRGVKLLRFCANAKNLKQITRLAFIAKRLGMTTAINVVRISSYSNEELDSFFSQIIDNDDVFDVIYTADSNGNLTPRRVDMIYDKLSSRARRARLGFHAHDNIGQAMANTLTAIENHGVNYVDASLLGMGKGIGNLRLEHLMAFLYCSGEDRYDPMPVLCAAERLRTSDRYFENDDYMVDVISGLHNLSIVERERAQELLKGAQKKAFPEAVPC